MWKCRWLNETYLSIIYKMSMFHPLKMQHCNFDHIKDIQLLASGPVNKVTWCRSTVDAHWPMWHVTVAVFVIPQLSSKWSNGIFMTSCALHDDIYLTRHL